jgi:hypothetical protein
MRVSCALLAVLAVLAGGDAGAALDSACDGPLDPRRGPRTLVIALDGVPHRVVQRARDAGAFEDWGPLRRLIAPFPSMTNVSFSAMLAPYGADPAGGYEIQHYDWASNEVVGGSPFGYGKRVFAWRDCFDVVSRSLGSKLSGYTTPGRHARSELEQVAARILDNDRELILVHIGSTDAMQHIHGDDEVFEFLLELDVWIREMREQHVERFGAPLSLVLLSDHGNSRRKIAALGPIHRHLRDEGLEPVEHLRDDNDVVAATFGIAGFGAVFTESDNAPLVARALAAAPFVDVVAWPSGAREISVVSGKKRAARILWRDGRDGMELAYVSEHGDPLRLHGVRASLEESGRIDARGFARDRDWLAVTERSRYPDALRRLVDAFTGEHVQNRATVMFSARPGRAWGWRSAHLGSWLRGGRLEGTHGGLDDESSVGFWMSSEPRDGDRGPVRAVDALVPFLPAWRRQHCVPSAGSPTAATSGSTN